MVVVRAIELPAADDGSTDLTTVRPSVRSSITRFVRGHGVTLTNELLKSWSIVYCDVPAAILNQASSLQMASPASAMLSRRTPSTQAIAP